MPLPQNGGVGKHLIALRLTLIPGIVFPAMDTR